ncbi:hypothetical protein [Haloarcula litorea]|uniref:hypothetical protein n=1 Tax=Haloarcula litorea TaxID=3032579 RepID=UPI0023E7D31A|nr:hypothetical protein [Halomicroarcula sp. GDY20]
MAADGGTDEATGDGDDEPRDEDAETGDFVEAYEYATEADVIQVEAADDGDEEAVAGSFTPDVEVTPGRPEPESVIFVALGVYIAVVALGQVVLGDAIYAPTTLAAITAAVAGTAALCYGVFVRTNPDT